jgi:cytochrome c2
MPTKALVFLLAFFLLLLPFLTTQRAVTLPAATETLPASMDAATAEATAAPTTAPTAEAAPELTPEATAEPAPEVTRETTIPAPTGDAAHGQEIFTAGLYGAPACINCHSTTVAGKNGFALGPGLKGIAEAAATRVDGLTAELYIEYSIRHPSAYVVGGFRDIMYASFDTDYNDQEIADLVAYLMTL